jgi:lipoprotein-anchoring transpeptidase ErfK/SrfK
MRRFIIALAAASMVLALGRAASADVIVTVDKSAQRLTVAVNGATRYEWPVSTARWGYRTPVGSYRPQRLERQWYSRKYDWSPMPHSIFFNGGYAIHGSYEVSRLGSPASHGCIRLAPANAATLFALVNANVKDTRIVVVGGEGPIEMVSRRSRTRYSNAEDDDTRPASRGRSNSFEEIFGAPRRR